MKKACSEINRGLVTSNTKIEGLRQKGALPLVVPNQRSVHRNDEDYCVTATTTTTTTTRCRERQSRDNADRKTTREDPGHPVTSHKATHDVCSLYGRVCTNAKAGRRTREIDFKQIIGYSVQGRLREYALHLCMRLLVPLYVHVHAYIHTYTYIYTHIRERRWSGG